MQFEITGIRIKTIINHIITNSSIRAETFNTFLPNFLFYSVLMVNQKGGSGWILTVFYILMFFILII